MFSVLQKRIYIRQPNIVPRLPFDAHYILHTLLKEVNNGITYDITYSSYWLSFII